MRSGKSRLLGIGTALPWYRARKETVARFMTRVCEECAPAGCRRRVVDLARKVFVAEGLGTRHSVIPDFGCEEPEEFTFFPANWKLEPFPTTSDRMRLYERESVELAAVAAGRALGDAGVEPRDVSHLVVSTCTGFFAPGPDVLLMERLGLRRNVKRTIIGFMGCHAGFNGMRAAREIVESSPGAVVLQVAVELCSIHYQRRTEPDLLVANSIFADGAAAALHGAAARFPRGVATLVHDASFVDEGSLEQMTWRIGDHGFEMRLSMEVPRSLRKRAGEFLEHLLDGAGVRRSEVSAWALHPGGPRILEALAGALGLGESELAASAAVLAEHGNMSSPTIFFVLEKILSGEAERPRGPLVALGFGPGLTIEGAVLET